MIRFCEKCIAEYASSSPLQMTCSLCDAKTSLLGKTVAEGAASLPTNYGLQNVIDMLLLKKRTPTKITKKFVVPREYEDPLTNVLMCDPVMLEEDGRTYERESIEKWFDTCREAAAAQPDHGENS